MINPQMDRSLGIIAYAFQARKKGYSFSIYGMYPRYQAIFDEDFFSKSIQADCHILTAF